MRKLFNICIKLFEDAITFFLVLIELFIVLQVVARYILHLSIPWTEEMSRYLIVLVGFAGGILVSRRGEHLGAYFLRDQAKGRSKAALHAINSAICAVYFLITGYGGWVMYNKVPARLTTSTVQWVQMRWLYIFLIIGCAGMALYSVRDFVLSLRAFVNNIEITREGRSAPFPEES